MGDASSFHWFKSRLLSVASARHYIGVNRVRVISHSEFADHDSREAEIRNTEFNGTLAPGRLVRYILVFVITSQWLFNIL